MENPIWCARINFFILFLLKSQLIWIYTFFKTNIAGFSLDKVNLFGMASVNLPLKNILKEALHALNSLRQCHVLVVQLWVIIAAFCFINSVPLYRTYIECFCIER